MLLIWSYLLTKHLIKSRNLLTMLLGQESTSPRHLVYTNVSFQIEKILLNVTNLGIMGNGD